MVWGCLKKRNRYGNGFKEIRAVEITGSVRQPVISAWSHEPS